MHKDGNIIPLHQQKDQGTNISKRSTSIIWRLQATRLSDSSIHCKQITAKLSDETVM